MTSLEGATEPARPPIVVGHLSDAELEDRLKRLAGIERKALVLLLVHLGEFAQRKLYADRGHPSLFSYCMRVLGYSEQAAYKRIQAARAARAHPAILERLADGELTLTAIVILSPHLRADNVMELLAEARGKRTREIEIIAAGLAPRPDSPDCLRALALPSEFKSPPQVAQQVPGSAGQDGAAGIDGSSGRSAPVRLGGAPRELIEPLSAQRHLFRFAGSSTLRAKYERAREFLGAAKSGGSMESVIEAGLDALLDKLDPKRRIARRRLRAARWDAGFRQKTGGDSDTLEDHHPASRKISAVLRDRVWERDGGRCTFMGPDGGRCPSTAWLEIDHIQPYAFGGPSDDAANLRLMCRAHNQLLARRVFGAAATRVRETPNPDSPQG